MVVWRLPTCGSAARFLDTLQRRRRQCSAGRPTSSSLLRTTPKVTSTAWRLPARHHLHFRGRRPTRRGQTGRLPACSLAPIDGAKDNDGGVEAAMCSPAATSSTLDDNVGAGCRRVARRPLHSHGRRRRRLGAAGTQPGARDTPPKMAVARLPARSRGPSQLPLTTKTRVAWRRSLP
jgi:hypothetical protein